MTITTRLSEKEYTSASLTILYNRVYYKIIAGVAGFFILVFLLTLFMSNRKADTQPVFTALILMTFMPLSVYLAAKKMYKTNHQVRETVAYTFTDAGVEIKGETYSSTLPWSTIYKVTQTKRWLLIWRDKTNASPVPVAELWGGQIADLKEILDNRKVKNNLNPSK